VDDYADQVAPTALVLRAMSAAGGRRPAPRTL